MVSVDENKIWWEDDYDWRFAGDEWSRPWGGVESQWYGTILPRIHRFLPASNILEIACGFGRWTQFLRGQSEHLMAIDLSETCVRACRQRFAGAEDVTFAVNDGSSLEMVEDSSIDFVFSFDSLVHADRTTLTAYIAQLPRILKPAGAAFIHHSNLGAYSRRYGRIARIPKLSGLLMRTRVLEYPHIRDPSVRAEDVAADADSVGLRCVSQELTTWLTRRTLIDCMSTVVHADGPHSRTNRVVRNTAFCREPGYLATLADLYSSETAVDGDV